MSCTQESLKFNEDSLSTISFRFIIRGTIGQLITKIPADEQISTHESNDSLRVYAEIFKVNKSDTVFLGNQYHNFVQSVYWNDRQREFNLFIEHNSINDTTPSKYSFTLIDLYGDSISKSISINPI